MAEARSSQMKKHWEHFAEDDPMYYIATWNKSWSVEDFFASGKDIVERMMSWIRANGGIGGDGATRMLEIGCGLGRTSVHFARHFDQVNAIDISQAMIEQARKLNPPENIEFSPSTGRDLSEFGDGSFDFVFSYIVFQHIPDAEVIETYIREIGRVTRDGGKAALQFDTRTEGALIRMYKALPDPLLPKQHRRFIRRYRRDPQWLRSVMDSAGLSVLDEQGARTDEHFFLIQKGVIEDPEEE